ncbi:MAG: transposase [Clostridia bacterium]|jgi:putative transposase
MDKLFRRKEIRLKHYDYSQAGYYFITICTKDKEKLFGEIIHADDSVYPQPVMKANEIGKIVCECWNKINDIYDHVRTDLFCLMPNHIHGIIIIFADGQDRPPLSKIIQDYKSVTTRMCFKYGLKQIWQRNYYEHIIRNEISYQEIASYIENNPLKWAEDRYYV